MKRIHTQRESFSYRVAADNPFDPSDDKKKKYFDLGNAIPGVQKQQDINALPQGHSSEPYEAAAAAVGPNAPGPRVPKMTVIPGAPSGGSAGGNTSRPSGGGSSNALAVGGPTVNPRGEPSGDAGGLLPETAQYRQKLLQQFPGADIGGYRPPDHTPWGDFYEHSSGRSLDFMHPPENQAEKIIQDAFSSGATRAYWQQQQWNPDGSRSPMENRGNDATQNHFDHIHLLF